MELFKKFLRSLLLGSLVGLGIALFTNFFFQDLIDRFENLTYYMRYSWEYDDLDKKTESAQEDPEYGIRVIDIDDRSMQKLGMYWNWDRSYHARLIKNLSKHFPATIVFDVLFFDPEDPNYARRLDNLLVRAGSVNPKARLSEQARETIVSTVDYDKQFVDATAQAGNVIHGIQMSDMHDYPDFSQSSVREKMTMEWHNQLHPTSALLFPPQVRKDAFSKGNTKTIIDGIFPPLAQAARDIGYVNVPPNKDGVTRNIPIAYGFGVNPPVYLPLSVRTVATLFGTPNDEINLVSGRYLDIGTPFKIFKDSTGQLGFSYPNVTVAQVRAIIDNSDQILALKPGKRFDVTSFLKVSSSEDGEKTVFMNYPGDIPAEVIPALLATNMEEILLLPVGESKEIGPEIVFRRDSDVEWVLSAPYGFEEWYFGDLDLRTLARLDNSHLEGVAPGTSKLIFHQFYVRNKGGMLVSSLPVLRGKTLHQLCTTPWEDIDGLLPGMRMDMGQRVKIPLDKNNNHIITFFGPKAKPFPYYSYYDILEDRVQAAMEGKIFIVGTTSPTMNDIVHVPHDDNYPGVEVHASLMNSLLTNTFVTRLEGWEDFAILLLIGLVIGVVAYMLKPLPGSILTILSVFAYFLLAMTVFGGQHLWIPIVRPILTIVLTFTAVMAYRYVTEEKDRKFLQSTFKQYLSPELIEIMYKQKTTPQLGGEEGVRTAYFTDIQSFSTFSEKLGSPTRLVELLNEYLTAMTDTLLSHYGTLDKYEGDAIIAFFGAPMPMEDHAIQACVTAMEMQHKLGDLRKKWASEGDKWPAIVHGMRMRIGVNTGAITTGNMGSAVRMNYTMMGDAVNLAARLESAAKQYGVFTMISEYTYELVKDAFAVRQADKIQVVGKSEPVVVYELIAEKDKVDPAIASMVKQYNEGLALFYDQQWDNAIAVLSQTELLEPYREIAPKGMSPSKKLISYCENFKINPPGSDWDGVIRLDSK